MITVIGRFFMPVATAASPGKWVWQIRGADRLEFLADRASGRIITAQRRERDGSVTLLAKYSAGAWEGRTA